MRKILGFILYTILAIILAPFVVKRFFNHEIVSGYDDKRSFIFFIREIFTCYNSSSTWSLYSTLDEWLAKRIVRYCEVSTDLFIMHWRRKRELLELRDIIKKHKYWKSYDENNDEYINDYERYCHLVSKHIVGKAWW